MTPSRDFYHRGMRIGIDLGGTKIEAVGLLPDGAELGRTRVDTPGRDYGAVIAAISAVVRDAEKAWGPASGVGIGTPGAIDPMTGLLKNSNSVVLNGKPLLRDVEAALGREVRVANDADCFALSEAWDGSAAGAVAVFAVIIGTGVGGGVVVRGRLLSGPNAVAGEWGHNPLPSPRPSELPGPACYCGLTGCVETFLSGPGLQRDHALRTGIELTPMEIANRAAAGDEAASDTMDLYVDRLARALGVVINLIDPDVIVLGGGLSNIELLYTAVPAVWSAYVLSDRVQTSLVRARHGDSSGVRGAARLWPE